MCGRGYWSSWRDRVSLCLAPWSSSAARKVPLQKEVPRFIKILHLWRPEQGLPLMGCRSYLSTSAARHCRSPFSARVVMGRASQLPLSTCVAASVIRPRRLSPSLLNRKKKNGRWVFFPFLATKHSEVKGMCRHLVSV